MKYACSECALHYAEKELAERCEEWCRQHDSCNYEIASQSLEARKA